MFERFTASARRVVVLSQDEARSLRHDHVGPLHLLLGVATTEDGTAGTVLASLEVTPEDIRRQAVSKYGRGESEPEGHIQFSDEGKKVFENALRESMGLDHNYIGTEHMLLGLIADSWAGDVLTRAGAQPDAVREAVMKRLSSAAGAEPAEP
jgi:ATP-dependent Clp protease ATP-binding subunit ClpC